MLQALWRRRKCSFLSLAAAALSILSLTTAVPLDHSITKRDLENASVDAVSEQRKLAVREAMQFVWTNYHERAFGADAMTPLDGLADDGWGHIGCMILDSMDTLYVMDLTREFEQAREWVRDELSFDNMGVVSVFETIIRSLGGLLSAYDLSKDEMFLTKAVELAERMLPAINTTTGRAFYSLNTATNETSNPAGLASSGSYQLEFEYLSRATGDRKYAELATKLYPYLQQHRTIQIDGLIAKQIYRLDSSEKPKSLTVKLGASSDSFYEYLLKLWILQGQPTNGLTKQMYLAAIEGMEKHLLHTSSAGGLFLGEYDIVSKVSLQKMEHLACFVPGLLALGADRLQDEDPERSAHHLDLAKQLAETCYKELYEKQATGLSPEWIQGCDLEMPPPEDDGRNFRLRPEVVESLYVLHQLTGDSKYQEWGWRIFSAIDKYCRTRFGYAQYRDVTEKISWSKNPQTRSEQEPRVLDNTMETFFTAETFKYLYLLFDTNNPHVQLDTHVFNTEAHPLSIKHIK